MVVRVLGLTLAVVSTARNASAENVYLDRARTALAAVEYEAVAPLLLQALSVCADPREEVEIREMLATMHVMFGRIDDAEQEFVAILALQPDYFLPGDSSPKVRAAFATARRRVETTTAQPLDAAALPPSTATREPLVTSASSPPLYERWWFWTAIGVVAAGATVGLWLLARPEPPDADLGPLKIP